MASILIVDDHITSHALFRVLLEPEGHTILHAYDGVEALAAVRLHHPDLVISDMVMPVMDGYKFVMTLRDDPNIAATKIILSSSAVSLFVVRLFALQHGALAVLGLPISPEEILEIVHEALAR